MAILRYAVATESCSENQVTGHAGKLQGGIGVNLECSSTGTFLHKKEWEQFKADVDQLIADAEEK